MTDKSKIIEKIKKCLALANSSNPNEAATALRQAQALIEKYQISDEEIQFSEINMAQAKAGKAECPATHVVMLANMINRIFNVEPVFAPCIWKDHSHINFYGFGYHPELAAYTFDVLLRQLTKHRGEYIKSLSNRNKTSTKTRKGDVFAQAWVTAVSNKVKEVYFPEEQTKLLESFIESKNTQELTPRNVKKSRSNDMQARFAGYSAGKSVELNRGVGGSDPVRRIDK